MKKEVLSLLILGLVAYQGFCCGKKDSSKKEPEWVLRPSSVYSNEEYLSSVGYAEDRNVAESKAINGIASIFKQKVTSKQVSSDKMAQYKQDGKVATLEQTQGFDQSILQEINEDDLIGIEVKEYWYDGKKNWYVIAILNKSKTASLYVDAITKNQDLIESTINSSDDDLFNLYARYSFAQGIASLNEDYINRLSVVNAETGKKMRAECTTSKELLAKKIEIGSNIYVNVVIDNDADGQIKKAFEDVVTELGFNSKNKADERYVLSGKVEYSEEATKDGKTIHCRYILSSQLQDANKGKIFMIFAENGREGHYNIDGAKTRAIKSLVGKIKNDFSSEFESYLEKYLAD